MLLQSYDENENEDLNKNSIQLYITPPINSKMIKMYEGIKTKSKQYFLYSDNDCIIDIEISKTSPTTVKLKTKTRCTHDTQKITFEDAEKDWDHTVLSRNGRYLLYIKSKGEAQIFTTRLVSIDKEDTEVS